MNASVTCAAVVALCVGVAACAPPRPTPGFPSSYGAADPTRYSRYDGSPYNYSDGSDPNFNNYSNRTAGAYSGASAYGGYYVAPPSPVSAYDPGPAPVYYQDQFVRVYTRDFYHSNSEPGWYDRWGRWHPSRAH